MRITATARKDKKKTHQPNRIQILRRHLKKKSISSDILLPVSPFYYKWYYANHILTITLFILYVRFYCVVIIIYISFLFYDNFIHFFFFNTLCNFSKFLNGRALVAFLATYFCKFLWGHLRRVLMAIAHQYHHHYHRRNRITYRTTYNND